MSGWTRILITGVGGQGVLSAGRWVGDAAFALGLPVVAGQVHGLAQRGGSVSASVVIGGARSWEIPDGMADVLLALEPMEGVRALPKISGRTTAIVNTRPILPISLQSQSRPYPPLSSLIDPVRERAGTFREVDATALAEEAGSIRALNVVMLGLMAGMGLLPFPAEDLVETIVTAGISALAEANRHAFELGMEAGR